MNITSEYLTIKQTASLLQCSSRTIYNLRTFGQLKYSKLGKSIRIKRTDIDLYLEQNLDHIQNSTGKSVDK